MVDNSDLFDEAQGALRAEVENGIEEGSYDSVYEVLGRLELLMEQYKRDIRTHNYDPVTLARIAAVCLRGYAELGWDPKY